MAGGLRLSKALMPIVISWCIQPHPRAGGSTTCAVTAIVMQGMCTSGAEVATPARNIEQHS